MRRRAVGPPGARGVVETVEEVTRLYWPLILAIWLSDNFTTEAGSG